MSIDKPLSKFTIGIADENIEVISMHDDLLLKVSCNRTRFLISTDKSNIVIKVHYGIIPNFNLGDILFDSNNWWKIYCNDENYIIQLLSPALNFRPIRSAIFDSEYKKGDLYVLLHDSPSQHTDSCIDSINYPKSLDPLNPALDMILMLNTLSQKNGVILHGCGLIDGDKGIIFCGISGSGKSTLANIWRGNAVILGDERIIIRRIKDRFWVYGTPWNRDAQMCSPKKAPLKKIYIIEHADINKAKLLQRNEAITKLLVRCFPPFFNRKGIEQILYLFDELTREIPCYELGFVPNDSIINFVRNLY